MQLYLYVHKNSCRHFYVTITNIHETFIKISTHQSNPITGLEGLRGFQIKSTLKMEDVTSSEKFQIPRQTISYYNTLQSKGSVLRFASRKIITKENGHTLYFLHTSVHSKYVCTKHCIWTWGVPSRSVRTIKGGGGFSGLPYFCFQFLDKVLGKEVGGLWLKININKADFKKRGGEISIFFSSWLARDVTFGTNVTGWKNNMSLSH